MARTIRADYGDRAYERARAKLLDRECKSKGGGRANGHPPKQNQLQSPQNNQTDSWRQLTDQDWFEKFPKTKLPTWRRCRRKPARRSSTDPVADNCSPQQLLQALQLQGRRGCTMKRATEYLLLNQAVDLLPHKVGRLLKMHTANGREGFILAASGRVKIMDAEKIIRRSDIAASEDSLLPGLTQTWRLAR
jgi:hypothetical protein